MVYCYSSFAYLGVLVAIEVDIRNGIPGIEIIGLPSSEIREARERIRVAIKNSTFSYPSKKILVNLAPADIKKYGVAFDLAIAVAILLQSGQIQQLKPENIMVLGELRLDGCVCAVSGILSAVLSAKDRGISHIILPAENVKEIDTVADIKYLALRSLADLQREELTFSRVSCSTAEAISETDELMPNLSDVIGQEQACRMVHIAATGRHNILLSGPPGIGKSMLAYRLPSLQPRLSTSEAQEVTRIYSLVDKYTSKFGLIYARQLRSPHHSASLEGIVGGGVNVLPGEISLAHHGVLLLDEVTEFRGRILQALREPMEALSIHIVRAGKIYMFPADFQLIATTNLCPCGNLGSDTGICFCTQQDIFRYWRKIGAPLLDRIELRLCMKPSKITKKLGNSTFRQMKEQSAVAINIQRERFSRCSYKWNSRIPPADVDVACSVDSRHSRKINLLLDESSTSLRSRMDSLRVARTISDLDERIHVHEEDVLEALSYRKEGRMYG